MHVEEARLVGRGLPYLCWSSGRLAAVLRLHLLDARYNLEDGKGKKESLEKTLVLVSD